jgi:stage V sporulation protein G
LLIHKKLDLRAFISGHLPRGRVSEKQRCNQGGPMQITEVKVFPVDEEKLRAYVTITLDHCFAIRDLKIIRGNTGYFVSMPSKKRKDGSYKDVAHPINNETRAMIEEKIMEEYERVTNEMGAKALSAVNVNHFSEHPRHH